MFAHNLLRGLHIVLLPRTHPAHEKYQEADEYEEDQDWKPVENNSQDALTHRK